MSMIKKPVAIIVHVVAPLTVGVMIYALFRPDVLTLHSLYSVLGISSALLVQMDFRALPSMYQWLFINLPDGLWFYAFVAYLLIVWSGRSRQIALMWVACAGLIAMTLELAPALNMIPGTFDWYDILSYGVAGMIAVFNIGKINQGGPHEKLSTSHCITWWRRRIRATGFGQRG